MADCTGSTGFHVLESAAETHNVLAQLRSGPGCGRGDVWIGIECEDAPDVRSAFKHRDIEADISELLER